MTDRISLGEVWEESRAFVRAELALLLPVACLGFGAPLVMVLLAVPADQARTGRLTPGPWMWWMVPAGLLAMTGSLAISALALRPGMSVAESLRLAMRRLPSGVGLIALNMAVQVALAVPIVVLAQIDLRRSGDTGPLTMLGNLAALAVMIWLYVRVLPVWAVLATRGGGPIAVARACFALTHGHYRRLLLLRVAGAVVGLLALLVVLVPAGALAGLIGMTTGAAGVGAMVSYVAIGLAFAAIVGLWTVYVARLYRRLGGDSIGT